MAQEDDDEKLYDITKDADAKVSYLMATKRYEIMATIDRASPALFLDTSLPADLPCKLAVFHVLSTTIGLEETQIVDLLEVCLKYRRSKQTIKDAIAHCVKFGLVEPSSKGCVSTSLVKYSMKKMAKKLLSCKYWRITPRGRDFALTQLPSREAPYHAREAERVAASTPADAGKSPDGI